MGRQCVHLGHSAAGEVLRGNLLARHLLSVALGLLYSASVFLRGAGVAVAASSPVGTRRRRHFGVEKVRLPLPLLLLVVIGAMGVMAMVTPWIVAWLYVWSASF